MQYLKITCTKYSLWYLKDKNVSICEFFLRDCYKLFQVRLLYAKWNEWVMLLLNGNFQTEANIIINELRISHCSYQTLLRYNHTLRLIKFAIQIKSVTVKVFQILFVRHLNGILVGYKFSQNYYISVDL